MEKLQLNLVPRRVSKITVKLSYAPRRHSRPIKPVEQTCAAHQKWQRVLSAMVPLSDIELAETLPELIIQLRADRSYFRNTKIYTGFVAALHLMGKNLGMDLRQFC